MDLHHVFHMDVATPHRSTVMGLVTPWTHVSSQHSEQVEQIFSGRDHHMDAHHVESRGAATLIQHPLKRVLLPTLTGKRCVCRCLVHEDCREFDHKPQGLVRSTGVPRIIGSIIAHWTFIALDAVTCHSGQVLGASTLQRADISRTACSTRPGKTNTAAHRTPHFQVSLHMSFGRFHGLASLSSAKQTATQRTLSLPKWTEQHNRDLCFLLVLARFVSRRKGSTSTLLPEHEECIYLIR